MTETRARPPDPRTSSTRPGGRPASSQAAAEFEQLYRAQVDAVMAYFARRSTEPQTVADLTAETFVQVITSFGSFDPNRGTARAWVFGIARRVYAAHCETDSRLRDKHVRMAGRRDLDPDQVDELVERIDAQRAGRRLVTELTSMPALDRAVLELVDLDGMSSKDAAAVLGLSAGSVRMRRMRARARLRRVSATGSAPETTATETTDEGNP